MSTPTRLIILSPEEVGQIVTNAVKQVMLQIENRSAQSVLSVSDIAKDSGFSADTVRSWIQQGRVAPGRKRVKLKILDGISDTYRIRWEAYQAFLAQFPDITCPNCKKPKEN